MNMYMELRLTLSKYYIISVIIIICVLLKETNQEDVYIWYQKAITSTKVKGDFETIMIELESEMDDIDEKRICDAFSTGAIIVIDLTWSGSELAEKLSNSTGIPYIRIDLSISPFLEFLDKYLDFRNSTDVAVIFDDPTVIDQSLYYWLDTPRLRLLMAESLDSVAARKLRSIRPTPNSFAIFADTKNMRRLFRIALQQNIVELPDRWNLVFTDFLHNNFNRSLLRSMPVSLLNVDRNICCHLLDLENGCACPDKFNIQEQFLQLALNTVLSSLVETMKDEADRSLNVVCNVTNLDERIAKNYKVILSNAVKNNDLLVAKNLNLRLKVTGVVEVITNNTSEILAKYTNETIILEENKTVTPIRAFYRIGITHALPWSYKVQNFTTGNWYWTGYCVDFAIKMAEQMDFDFEFVEPKSGDFGRKVDGVWNGVVGDLASGETDLAVTAIIMTADREEVVDFVAPYFEQTGISIVMRKPVRKTSLFKFMTVLKLEVWLSIVAALIATGFMVWFLDKYSPYSARNNKRAYPYPCREFTLKESFWFALTSFTPQGGGEAPKALSGRTLVAAYWLFVVLMLATFTANLAAFLTVERMQAPVQSLEQLAKQSRINYTVVKNSQTHKYFINMKFAEDTLYRMWKELTLNASTDDSRYRVWDYPIREQYGHILLAINDSEPVATAEDGFNNVDEHLDADYAFIHDSSEIKYEISRNCNLTEVGEVFAEKPYAVAVQQGSHLQDDISKTILKLQKDRFFEELQAKYWNHSLKGDCPSTDDNEGITLESLGGVFIATLFGLALAMITLAGEVLYYRRKRRIREQQKLKSKSKLFLSNLPPPKKLVFPEHGTITIGDTFKPINLKEKMQKERDELRKAHINLYPRARNRIAQSYN